EAIELYDRHLYEKGACVYHMIRAELGEALFSQAIATFVKDNAHCTVETVDLLRAIEKATGRNLLWLFDQYVYRGGHPDYKVAYAWDGDSNLAKITVTQTQVKANSNGNGNGSRSELFDLKIPIAFGYVEQEQLQDCKTFTVRVHEREQTFYFPLTAKPQLISFDQGNHLLKTVSLEYPLAELKAQLQFDPDPISRIYAAEALAKKGGLEAVKALAKALEGDRFWGVRAEVSGKLAEIKLDQAFTALVLGLQDSEARVRRAVVEALGTIKTQESYKAIKPLAKKGDASYYVEAAALRAIGGIAATLQDSSKEEEPLKLLQSALKKRSGWNETVRSGAIAGLSQMKTSEAALVLILEYTAPDVPQALRLAAIRALGAISSGQTNVNLERILERLNELSKETFFLTQVAVVSALGQMETTKAIRILQGLVSQTPDGRVRRIAEEAIQRVQKHAGSDQAVKQLREELDQLKKENQDLKSRLENLEAKAK
ncbi:MAG: M1 family metallopeptidase, partial [Leptolyngbyaceae bacterium]|nr:M1 family metallopeptidase [Leptolyngbyaceae bacterium]